ncbi:glycosyltransferase family 2 protein [Ralstonia insidiosa]|uniref:Glycosyltransferase n=1 Tax=Ralstonia insidiosa TaxID=190721 RepID=A0A848P180_9RALS|nr:glycosyltransferase family 2 protein [Ralstonia insidiosa]NMV39287.1 glycosyltransferase [Ralstonia insidiosa]
MSKHAKHRRTGSNRSEIALVVIARNEAACIERCLLSAKPHVDRMIVLDTGSTDDTVAIAQACGAQVHHFTWVDDFSAARNAALAAANADWNLVLDADEWIESGAEELRTACTFGPLLGVVCIRSEYDFSGHTEQSNSWISRLLPRGVRYKGRVHEQPAADLQRVRLPLVLGHDGYMNVKLDKKRGRNHNLLQQELAAHPDDPYALYQLGKDFEIYQKDPAQAAAFYQRALAVVPRQAPYRHDLCICLLACLAKSKQLDQAITLAGEWMEEWSGSPDYFYMLGHLMFEAATQDAAQAEKQWLPMAESAFLKCLEIGEQPKLDASVFGRGSFAAAKYLALTYRAQSETLAIKANQYLHLAQQMREKTEAAVA